MQSPPPPPPLPLPSLPQLPLQLLGPTTVAGAVGGPGCSALDKGLFLGNVTECVDILQHDHDVHDSRCQKLAFIHIAKTGGTAVNAWAYFHRMQFRPPGQARSMEIHRGMNSDRALHLSGCNTTMTDKRGLQAGATSREHCPEFAALLATLPGVATFCAVREPISRLVSAYNMGGGRGCSAPRLRSWVWKALHRGHNDNFDRPQVEYARHCSRILCFGQLEEDFSRLVRGALRPGRDTAFGRPCAAPIRGHGDTSLLPRAQPGSRVHSNCTTDHLDDDTMALVIHAYHDDALFHASACQGAFSPSEMRASSRAAELRRRGVVASVVQSSGWVPNRFWRSWDVGSRVGRVTDRVG
jgi:hypothetical protein